MTTKKRIASTLLFGLLLTACSNVKQSSWPNPLPDRYKVIDKTAQQDSLGIHYQAYEKRKGKRQITSIQVTLKNGYDRPIEIPSNFLSFSKADSVCSTCTIKQLQHYNDFELLSKQRDTTKLTLVCGIRSSLYIMAKDGAEMIDTVFSIHPNDSIKVTHYYTQANPRNTSTTLLKNSKLILSGINLDDHPLPEKDILLADN